MTVAVIGSTGSIGRQTLDVVRAAPDRFEIVALAASTSVDVLVDQTQEWHPECVAIANRELAGELAGRVPQGTEVLAGAEALADAARLADVVVNAVVGFAGLPVTLAALEGGRRLALANKESLIAGGPVVQRVRRSSGGEIVPVDSEHSAIHQCLRSGRSGELARIVLTASGGPFRGRSRGELMDVTVDDALAHPTWRMGPKITVDSSTLMNKGLEVIEAHELFDAPYERVEVVVHPQSVVHSMVEFTDGATIAQLSMPDMRLPIGYALGYPDRLDAAFGSIDWAQVARLEFERPDPDVFPCLGLAYEAGRAGGSAPAWLNAANEVAVAAFLDKVIRWIDIPEVLKSALSEHHGADPDTAEAVIDADRQAREVARKAVQRRAAA